MVAECRDLIVATYSLLSCTVLSVAGSVFTCGGGGACIEAATLLPLQPATIASDNSATDASTCVMADLLLKLHLACFCIPNPRILSNRPKPGEGMMPSFAENRQTKKSQARHPSGAYLPRFAHGN